MIRTKFRWAFSALFRFRSKNRPNVRNREIRVKREAQLWFLPNRFKSRHLHSFSSFPPGEGLPGAGFHILNGAKFSLFCGKSLRNGELQIQPYFHPDIHSQRDFFCSLWPRKYMRHSNNHHRVSVQAPCSIPRLQTSCSVVKVSSVGRNLVPLPAYETLPVSFQGFHPESGSQLLLPADPAMQKSVKVPYPSLPVHLCPPISFKYERDCLGAWDEVPCPQGRHGSVGPLSLLCKSLVGGSLSPHPHVPWCR